MDASSKLFSQATVQSKERGCGGELPLAFKAHSKSISLFSHHPTESRLLPSPGSFVCPLPLVSPQHDFTPLTRRAGWLHIKVLNENL